MKRMQITGNDGCAIVRSLKMRYIVTFGMYRDSQAMIGESNSFDNAEAMAKQEVGSLHNPWTTKVYELRPHQKPRLLAEYQHEEPTKV